MLIFPLQTSGKRRQTFIDPSFLLFRSPKFESSVRASSVHPSASVPNPDYNFNRFLRLFSVLLFAAISRCCLFPLLALYLLSAVSSRAYSASALRTSCRRNPPLSFTPNSFQFFIVESLAPVVSDAEGGRALGAIKKKLSMEAMQHTATFLLPSISSGQKQPGPSLSYALIVLNQRLPRFTPLLWNNANLRVFADGGANRVYDEMPQFFPDEDVHDVRSRYKPDAIKGDLDSIRSDVQDFYAGLGCKVIDQSHDQETTDLHKCVAHIQDCTADSDKPNLCVLVTGALGGRFDHEAGNINVLFRFSTMRIVLLSDDCLIHLLPKTCRHEIHIQPSVVGSHCGLIPMGMPSGRCTTTGLEWNLTDTEMKFGGLVSTSNLVKGDVVTVQSDADILWTISIKKLD